jgi:hypothetical protein
MRQPRRSLLTEVSRYPDYLRFSTEEMKKIFDMFWSVVKSVWQSIKLLTATLELNLKVVLGTWTGNRKMIDDAFGNFQTKRQSYDTEMRENLKYFKEYVVDAGPGPKFLAFAANPLLFASMRPATVVVGRGTGEYSPYDVNSPYRSALGVKSNSFSGSKPAGATGTTAAGVKITPRLKRALDFFEYDASRLSEAKDANEQPQFSKEAQLESQKLQDLASEYVKSERKNAAEIAGKISGISSSIRKITDAKSFDELVSALGDAQRAGIKVSVNEVKSASTKIKEELARQQKESPEEFKKSVDLMRQKSKDLKDADPLDVASNFVFGMSKSNVQRELIKLQEEVMGTARKTMNLPLDPETKAQLQQTEIGQEYLKILDDFEQSLQQGEAGSKSLKSNLRI